MPIPSRRPWVEFLWLIRGEIAEFARTRKALWLFVGLLSVFALQLPADLGNMGATSKAFNLTLDLVFAHYVMYLQFAPLVLLAVTAPAIAGLRETGWSSGCGNPDLHCWGYLSHNIFRVGCILLAAENCYGCTPYSGSFRIARCDEYKSAGVWSLPKPVGIARIFFLGSGRVPWILSARHAL